MKLAFEKPVLELMNGAIDIHIHSAPDVAPRILNVTELARHAQEMGMKAIVLKNHFVETAAQAQITNYETNFPTFGGICLNYTVGGLNRYAVENALALGAKIVWLPTFHSKYFIDWFKENMGALAHFSKENNDLTEKSGLYILGPDGGLKEEMIPIFDLIAKYNAVLATGHVSVKEAKVAVREAVKRGVKRIVLTHPEAGFLNYKIEDMKEMLNLGVSYLEFVYCSTTRQVQNFSMTPEALCKYFKVFGAKYCIMSTDSGQWVNPIPAQQSGMYIRDALTFGCSVQEVRTMNSENPAKVLGI
jgi:hypothetical protein